MFHLSIFPCFQLSIFQCFESESNRLLSILENRIRTPLLQFSQISSACYSSPQCRSSSCVSRNHVSNCLVMNRRLLWRLRKTGSHRHDVETYTLLQIHTERATTQTFVSKPPSTREYPPVHQMLETIPWECHLPFTCAAMNAIRSTYKSVCMTASSTFAERPCKFVEVMELLSSLSH